jgi:hypothetical protein
VAERVLATSDCERCRAGAVSQPANAVSSLAYVLAGAAVLRTRQTGPDRTTEQAVGWATVAVGLGSVAYHGPGGAVSRYAHDAGIIALLGLVAWADVEAVTGKRAPAGPAVITLVAAVGAAPRFSPTAQALAGVAAAVAGSTRFRRGRRPDAAGHPARGPHHPDHPDPPGRPGTPATPPGDDGSDSRSWSRAAVPLGVMAVAAQVLGRSGGPWCRPDSLLQPHAVWHVLTAALLWRRSTSVR